MVKTIPLLFRFKIIIFSIFFKCVFYIKPYMIKNIFVKLFREKKLNYDINCDYIWLVEI